MGADLEGGAQLDVHRGHEMLLLQQQQRLSVDLLRQELGGQILAAWTGRRNGEIRSKWRQRTRDISLHQPLK